MADETVHELFDQYAARYARGESPDVREYLARAAGGADELARLIDAFLQAAPPREPSPESVELLRSRLRGEPPLLEARVRSGLKREDVVERLRVALGLGERTRAALRRRYHELESGLLAAAGVDPLVWKALDSILGANARRLGSWRPARPVVPELYARAAAAPASFDAQPDAERDEEVDRLFLSAG